MKNFLAYTVFTLFIFLGFSSFSQSSESVFVHEYTLDEDTQIVRVSLKTDENFIVGANRYVLHIGGRHFLRNEHPDGRLDEIVFLIPLSDFETIEENKEIVLVYGLYHENTLQDEEGGQLNGFTGKHWRLGTFTSPNLKN